MEHTVILLGRLQFTKLEFIGYSVLFFIIIGLWFYNKWSNRHFSALSAKMTKLSIPSLPIIGSVFAFIGSPERVIDRMNYAAKHNGGGPCYLWLGPYFVVVVAKPEDVQVVLNSSKALDKGPFYNVFKNTVGDGLFSGPVNKWRHHRRAILPAFNAKLMEQFFPVFNEKNKILVKMLTKEVGKETPFDLWDYIETTAVDIICQTAMGYNVGSQSNSKTEYGNSLAKALEADCTRVYKPWLYSDTIFSMYAKFTGVEKAYKTLHQLPTQIIKEKRAVHEKNKMKHKSIKDDDEEKKPLKIFLDILLELNDSGANFSDKDIVDEVMTMMIAGSDTVAVVMSFCLLLLAIYQDIQDKVYDELYEIFGDGDEEISLFDIPKLEYLDKVIKETLRMYPPGPVFVRQLDGDVQIVSDNLVLPKGTLLCIAPISTHQMPEIYPNPGTFNPENFTQECIDKRHKYSFIPFSGGLRGCIGSKFAMLSMKSLLSTFLRNYSIHTHIKHSDIKLRHDLLLRSVNGFPVTIQKRDRRPKNKRTL